MTSASLGLATGRLERAGVLRREFVSGEPLAVESVAPQVRRPEQEVRIVERRGVSKETVKQFAIRSTKESAKLERRTVPEGHVRSERVERFLAERRQRA